MAIERWTRRDIPRVKDLLDELADAIGEARTASVESMEHQFTFMSQHPEAYANYVYRRENQVVGFVSVIFFCDVACRAGKALVNELVVTGAWRQQGLGGALLTHARERARARGLDELQVGLVKGNLRAREFYRRHGISEEYVLLGGDLL